MLLASGNERDNFNVARSCQNAPGMTISTNNYIGNAVPCRYDVVDVDQNSRALSRSIRLVPHSNNRAPDFASQVGLGAKITTTSV
jgi:hypothetical protein